LGGEGREARGSEANAREKIRATRVVLSGPATWGSGGGREAHAFDTDPTTFDAVVASRWKGKQKADGGGRGAYVPIFFQFLPLYCATARRRMSSCGGKSTRGRLVRGLFSWNVRRGRSSDATKVELAVTLQTRRFSNEDPLAGNPGVRSWRATEQAQRARGWSMPCAACCN
jgi:hypothetical protein